MKNYTNQQIWNESAKKFGQDCILYNYYIKRNSLKKITISDADFQIIDPNYVPMIVAYLQDKQTSKLGIRAYNAALNFLKDYIV